jgi:hypothetical protein
LVFVRIVSWAQGRHIALMEKTQAGEFTYSIERGFAGAGRRVWRWVVRRGNTGAELGQGASIRSRDDARMTALAVIQRLRPPERRASV